MWSCPQFLDKYVIGRDIQQWQNPHNDSAPHRARTLKVGRSKQKPLEHPLPAKMVKHKQYHIPGGTAEISATIEDLKDAGVVIPTACPLNPPIPPVQKVGGSWSMTVGYCKLTRCCSSCSCCTTCIIIPGKSIQFQIQVS